MWPVQKQLWEAWTNKGGHVIIQTGDKLFTGIDDKHDGIVSANAFTFQCTIFFYLKP